jgi:hypothetical protein
MISQTLSSPTARIAAQLHAGPWCFCTGDPAEPDSVEGPMEAPAIERLSPVTIEFLRVVNGVEAARLSCGDCKAAHVVTWDELGLPDDTPFPPPEELWKCGRCGGTHVSATPEWPVASTHQHAAPIDEVAEPSPSNDESEEDDTSPLRDELEVLMARFKQG